MNWWGQAPDVPGTLIESHFSHGLAACPWAPENCHKDHSALQERKAVFYAGFFWKRWHAVHRCQLLVLPAIGFDLCHHFSCLILLIKESLFSIMLNQDLFIVQETIKTLMGCDWPSLPLWPYFFTACTQPLHCVKLPPDSPSQMPAGPRHRLHPSPGLC